MISTAKAKELIESTSRAALEKDPIDDLLYVYVDKALNVRLDDYDILEPNAPFPEHFPGMAPSGIDWTDEFEPEYNDVDLAYDKISGDELDEAVCVLNALKASKKKTKRPYPGVSETMSETTQNTEEPTHLQKLDKLCKSSCITDFDVLLEKHKEDQKAWAEKLKKSAANNVDALFRAEESSNFEGVTTELIQQGLRIIPRCIVLEVQSKVDKALEPILSSSDSLSVSPEQFVESYLKYQQFCSTNMPRVKSVPRKYISFATQTDLPELPMKTAICRLFNYAITDSCKSPSDRNFGANSQPVDAELLASKLQVIADRQQRRLDDTVLSLDPDRGLVVEKSLHQSLYRSVKIHGETLNYFFEDLNFDSSYKVQTVFYRRWYKVVFKIIKVVLPEKTEILKIFHGCYPSRVVPKYWLNVPKDQILPTPFVSEESQLSDVSDDEFFVTSEPPTKRANMNLPNMQLDD